jgi:YD repeat-containing protein
MTIGFAFPLHGQGDSILIGTEKLNSRREAGLVGPVRSLLTVEKREEDGYVRTLSTIVSTYERNGAAIETLFHDADIEMHSQQIVAIDHSSIYFYNAIGQVEKVVHYDPDGSDRGQVEYRYDLQGRLIERKTYVGAKELFDIDLISYPAKLRSLEKRQSYDGGRVTPGYQWLSIFNEKGELVEKLTLKPDGSPDSKIIYSYDPRGNVTKEAHYDEKNAYRRAHIFLYKFDDRGNWVERKDIVTLPDQKLKTDEKAWMMTYRVITYYGQR